MMTKNFKYIELYEASPGTWWISYRESIYPAAAGERWLQGGRRFDLTTDKSADEAFADAKRRQGISGQTVLVRAMGAKPQRIAKLGKLTAPSKRRRSSFPRKSGGL